MRVFPRLQPQRIPEDIPDRMPERLSEGMPDAMPGRVSGTRCVKIDAQECQDICQKERLADGMSETISEEWIREGLIRSCCDYVLL